MVPRGLDVPVEKLAPHPKLLSQFEYDLVVCFGFPSWKHYLLAEHDKLFRFCADLEADFQSIVLPRRVGGENDIRIIRRRSVKEIAMHVELNAAESFLNARRTNLGKHWISAEGYQSLNRVGIGCENGLEEVPPDDATLSRRPKRKTIEANRFCRLTGI